ncbi:putative response regulator receiver protein (CheY-like) [Bradyrhizobium sp. STM 3843]|uniref:response regulator n=1 Tax=Bradyrhizobium sp. STM 3843 TaxID=551947 RepID=UPI000240560B|nr:response regulator [Bradyrhizobium sp. STM 3843]CCE11872.1 putative response regulator receiver protein (CheY-like) [Bradyrhizobium sp. STM 3843]
MSVISSDAVRASSSAGPEGASRALQLLIVDDDATQRALIAVAAKQAGHVVTAVGGRDQAMEAIRSKRFDCITLDLMLGDGDGTEVLKTIADCRFAGSVIVISGMDASRRSAARSYAKSLGIDLQSLPKPVDLSALRICLANIGKTALGLPTVHSWGGVAAESVVAKHRA